MRLAGKAATSGLSSMGAAAAAAMQEDVRCQRCDALWFDMGGQGFVL
jgi:hypothetical protein